MRTLVATMLLLVLAVVVALAAGDEPDDGWVSLFDGESLAGWAVLRSGHGEGGKWAVVDGAIEGRQDPPGLGGVLASERVFGDFEITAEINPDWPMDSGLFLRAQPGGRCYQVTIDYRGGGQVGTLYGEGTGGWLQENKGWREHWRKDEWNHLRARVVGNPPRIEIWLNGEQTVDFTDDRKRLPDTGHIGLQVHKGNGYQTTATRFRAIRIKELPPTE